MADITASVVSWSTTESSNQPTDSTSIGAGLDDNLRAIQAGTAREFAKGSDLPSASSVDIGASGTSGFVDITGTTTITSFATARAGTRRWVRFTGALTLTHNATSLILPGGANITTAAGDVALFISLGSGNWICAEYPTVMASATVAGNATVGATALAGQRQLAVTNSDSGAGSSATTYVQSNAGQIGMSVGSTAAGGTASLLSSSTGAMNVYSSAAVQLGLGTNNRADDIIVTSAGVVGTAGTTAPTGYTTRGDVVLPAARAVRARNTAKAYVNFDGTPTGGYPLTLTVRDSFGVASVTKTAVGAYTIALTSGLFADANYTVSMGVGDTSGTALKVISGPRTSTPTATEFKVTVTDGTPNLTDANYIHLTFFGN